ncbi:hypothetical protein DPMN_030379 [Dreissena polymorpha]|uniref:Uncharacterized protein n=1 Tax=Dreissena polymorpha TaxID=45954 RepID=A0A9D4RH20_DREPO|nr:hypothetical protein DPMN_030379 [Dreissena polymorpha]
MSFFQKLYFDDETLPFAHLRGFHDDWAKIKLPPGSHVIQLTGTIFQLNSLFTCFHCIHIEKNVPPTGGHVFSPIWTIFELVRHINKTNVLINFHDHWAKIVTSKVFTRKTAPPTGVHIGHKIFELDRDIIGANLLTKFHEDRRINVASRVFTNKCGCTDDGRTDDGQKPVTKAPLSNQSVECPAHWRPCFLQISTIFKLVQEINKTNVLTNFHDDWAKIVTSRVFTRKTALPTGGHVFQWTIGHKIFNLDRDFIETKFLTNFHEDRTINVASRVFTNKQRLVTKAHLSNQMWWLE